jgi:hypothetical protein
MRWRPISAARLQHEASLALPFRLIQLRTDEFVIQMYMEHFKEYKWCHVRGCIWNDGVTPGFGFFTDNEIESTDTRKTMREAIRYFRMLWEYIYAADSVDLRREKQDIQVLTTWDSMDAMLKEYNE